MIDLVDPWSTPETVCGFVQSAPNPVLMRYAAGELARGRGARLLDIGCGAGRNAVPLAESGWRVIGLDTSWPMLTAAASRTLAPGAGSLRLGCAAMDALPVPDRSADLIVAHGIWNLAASGAEFRRAVREAARAAAPGAALFVFTFSRHTLPPDAQPVPGETFVYTQFSGRPQIFLTAGELTREMAEAGFEADPAVPLTEYNRPKPGALRTGSGPVIYEAAFRATERMPLTASSK
jgi:ubiquinone/menaquinone biosynthesis C-methylase UbiE